MTFSKPLHVKSFSVDSTTGQLICILNGGEKLTQAEINRMATETPEGMTREEWGNSPAKAVLDQLAENLDEELRVLREAGSFYLDVQPGHRFFFRFVATTRGGVEHYRCAELFEGC